MTAPTPSAPSPLASPSTHSRASSWWSTVASAASTSWSRLPSLVPLARPPPPPPHPHPTAAALPHHASPPLSSTLSESDQSGGDDTSTSDALGWQVVLTNHGRSSSIDGSSCPLVMPESQFAQLPQLQPIHGLRLPVDDDDDSGSDTSDDDDDDEYVTRTPPVVAAAEAAAAVAVAVAVASPLMLPSIPTTSGHEPMLVATVDAYSMLDDGRADHDAASMTSSTSDDDEVEMSIDQLDVLMRSHDRAPVATSPRAPSPPLPPSTPSLSPTNSGILVPIPSWAWHLILNPNASTPTEPPKPPMAHKSKVRTGTMDLRRVARDDRAARGCMGRYQRQHGPQPAGAGARHKKRGDGGGKRVSGKSAV